MSFLFAALRFFFAVLKRSHEPSGPTRCFSYKRAPLRARWSATRSARAQGSPPVPSAHPFPFDSRRHAAGSQLPCPCHRFRIWDDSAAHPNSMTGFRSAQSCPFILPPVCVKGAPRWPAWVIQIGGDVLKTVTTWLGNRFARDRTAHLERYGPLTGTLTPRSRCKTRKPRGNYRCIASTPPCGETWSAKLILSRIFKAISSCLKFTNKKNVFFILFFGCTFFYFKVNDWPIE